MRFLICWFFILLFWFHLPFEKKCGHIIYLNKFESHSQKDSLCQFCCIFTIFILSPLRKGHGPLKFQSPSPIIWMCSANLGRNWLSVSEENSMYFWYLVMKGWVPSFEETWLPLTQGCKNLFEIGSVVLENTGKLNVYDDDNDDNCQILVRRGKKIKEFPKCWFKSTKVIDECPLRSITSILF